MELSDCLPFWDTLSEQQRQQLVHAAALRTVEKGAVIHGPDGRCTGLLAVVSGQLRAYILSEEGREITLYRLFERDICLFSASCMLRSIQFDIAIEAEKDTAFWVIRPEVYKDLMERLPAVANYTNELMADRFSEVMWRMEQTLWKSFDKRLAAFLLEEAALEGSDVLKITHEAIGHHLGNPREVVTRMLRYFQGEGLVELARGSVRITDMEGLRALAG